MEPQYLTIIISAICILIVSWALRRFLIDPEEKTYKISFKESLDLAELPIVTFYQGKTKINFILDTGANNSIIDETFAENLETTLIDNTSDVVGIDGRPQVGIQSRLIKIAYKDVLYEDVFKIIDMSASFQHIKRTTGVTVHGMLGNNFFQKYKYVLDFEEMIAYSKSKKK